MASPQALEHGSSPRDTSSTTSPASQALSPNDSSAPPASASLARSQISTSISSIHSAPMMVNGKIALPPQSQAMPVGPASKVYTIPPRPKPGRKPKEPAADDIRKEQNRAAQKKFRNKQHDRIQALNEEVGQRDVELTTLRIEVNNLNNALALAHSQIEAMRQQIFTLEMEREADRINLKRQADEVKRESKRRRSAQQPSEAPAFDNRSVVDQTGADIPMSDSMHSATPGNPTPPYEMEIDFTNFGQPAHTAGDSCGFCDGGDFCACSMKIKSPQLAPLDMGPPTSPATVPLKRNRDPATATVTAPGTCETCLRDPEQARKCQELAKATKYSPVPPTSSAMLGIKSGPDGLLSDPLPERTSCSDFLAKFRPLDTTKYRSIIGKLHTFPHVGQPGTEDEPFRPALDLDAKEAAEALTSLAAKSKRR